MEIVALQNSLKPLLVAGASHCYGPKVCISPNLYVETLTPNVKVLEVETLRGTQV